MSTELALILVLIFVGGFLGGTAGWILREAVDGPEYAVKWGYWGYVSLGVISSFTVPFILTTLQSDLLGNVQKIQEPKAALTLLGICIVVSFSSRRFMTSMSETLLKKIEKNKEDTEKALQIAERAEDQSDEIRENILQKGERSDQEPARKPHDLNDSEWEALKAAKLMKLRTRTGIAKDSRIPINKISEILQSLQEKGLLEQTRSTATGGIRYKITNQGAAALGNEVQD